MYMAYEKSISLDGGGDTWNLEEHARSFTKFTGMTSTHFTIEATRESSTVMNNILTLSSVASCSLHVKVLA
ncbi:hypothetical protein RDI58_001125 [Solanum bulbocastanum]|uniref:Uncharacterized protein n=1 Tax=Solanum bulbocastanum TaxID=147425 RepID=A0AAN8YPW0_SOLBU